MKQTIKKELLHYNRKSLQTLHKVFGFDFEKDSLNINQFNGSFTVNSVLKKFNLNPATQVITLIIQGDQNYNKDYRYLIMIDKDKEVVIENINCHRYIEGFHTFYAKYQFNDLRKRNKKDVIVISQNKSDIVFAKPKDLDNYERSKVKKVNYYTVAGNEYINRIYLQQNNNIFRENALHHTKTIDEVIDKSGYLKEAYSRALARKLLDFKHANDLKKAASFDLIGNLIIIDKKFKLVNNKLVEILIGNFNDKTYDDLKGIIYKLSDYMEIYVNLKNGKYNTYSLITKKLDYLNINLKAILKALLEV